MVESNVEESPAESPMKSRELVGPGRHKEVNLAAQLRIMCLYLNEKAKRKKETGESWAKILGMLPSQDTWGMQQQLSLCSKIARATAIRVRKTALLVQSASLIDNVNRPSENAVKKWENCDDA